jgi:hypothetical protein
MQVYDMRCKIAMAFEAAVGPEGHDMISEN